VDVAMGQIPRSTERISSINNKHITACNKLITWWPEVVAAQF